MSRIADLAPDIPRLHVSVIERNEVVLGTFQRAASALRGDEMAREGITITRRRSGGPAVRVAPGTLHVTLVLPSSSALVAGDPSRIVNRHVRPLLRALSSLGTPAHYFGRDWVSVSKRPAAWVGFAHDAASGACLFEAFVGVTTPFALPTRLDGYPARQSDPFLGKAPASLGDLYAKPIDPASLAVRILEAYDTAFGTITRATWPPELLRPEARDTRPAFDTLIEEVIGFVGAARDPITDKLEIGGDLFASEGLLTRIAELIDARRDRDPGVPDAELDVDAIGAALLDTIGDGYVIDGVRRIESLIRASPPPAPLSLKGRGGKPVNSGRLSR